MKGFAGWIYEKSLLIIILILFIAVFSANADSACAGEIDVTVNEQISLVWDGKSPELHVSELKIKNNSANSTVKVDSILAETTGTWCLVSDSTDFAVMEADQKKFSLTAEGHDLSGGPYNPVDLQIAPEGVFSVSLSGKTGASTVAVYDELAAELVISFSLAEDGGGSDGPDDSGDTDSPGSENPAGSTLPEGSTYTVAATGTVLNPGDSFPEKPGDGDIFSVSDYEYRYRYAAYAIDDWQPFSRIAADNQLVCGLEDGWSACVYDNTKTEYAPLYSEIAGMPLTSLFYTFSECANLTKTPDVPGNVTVMFSAFINCKSLTEIEPLPDSVLDMVLAFSGCSSLVEPPVLPEHVVSIQGTFSACSALAYAPVIPATVEDMGITFLNCTALKEAPVIPDGVTSLNSCFMNCSSLQTMTSIPASVTDMFGTFRFCTELTGEIEVNANPTSCNYCFLMTRKPIHLTGSAAAATKAKLASTSYNKNVTYDAEAAALEMMEEGTVVEESSPIDQSFETEECEEIQEEYTS